MTESVIPDTSGSGTVADNSKRPTLPRESRTLPRHARAFMDLQRTFLVKLLFKDPEKRFPGRNRSRVDYDALFASVRFRDMEIVPNYDKVYRLPSVLNFDCKRAYAFDYYVELFSRKRNPDRLVDVLLQCGFKAVLVRHQDDERFLLLRSEDFERRRQTDSQILREHLNPLFEGADTLVPADLVDTLLNTMRDSARLDAQARRMQWIQTQRGDLLLTPARVGTDTEESIQMFLFLREYTGSQQLRRVIESVLAGNDTLVPREMLEDFLGAIDRLPFLERKASQMNWVQLEGSGNLLLESSLIDDDQLARVRYE